MANPNPNLSGISRNWANDTTGPTTTKSFRIEIDMLEWLASLDGQKGSGKHVRQALRDYREKMEESLKDAYNDV